MLTALRRVISEASEIGDDETPKPYATSGAAEGAGAAATAAVLPHTIVMEEEEEEKQETAPLALVHSSTGPSDNCTASSSLSDGSVGNQMEDDDDDEDDAMDVKEADAKGSEGRGAAATEKAAAPTTASALLTATSAPGVAIYNLESDPQAAVATAQAAQQQNLQYRKMLLQHMDSAATNDAGSKSSSSGGSGTGRQGGSQTSSRDWGWFEDVHNAGAEAGTGGSSSGGGGGGNGSGGHSKKKTGDAATGAMAPQEIIHLSKVTEEAAAVTAPTYVLEESLSSQKLWKDTAGNRPPQPMEERAFYEKMWAQNFARSQVNYQMPVEVLTATSPVSLNPFADGVFEGDGAAGASQMMTTTDASQPKGVVGGDKEAALISRMHDMADDHPHLATASGSTVSASTANAPHFQKVPGSKSDGDLAVLLRGPNAFGTTVSKSFARSTDNGGAIVGVDTVNISIASYRIVESKKYGKYAQFLVIYREGSIRDTVGVWKRYRDFEELSHKVTQAHEGCAAVIANMSPLAVTEEPETEHLPNAITSWRLLKKRKRWYRCLDAGYLSLKVFLLERFLHDILFESSSPKLLRNFVLGPESDGPPL